MLRYLFNRLASEKFVEYLSQTYLIKRAAQITASAYYRSSGDKMFTQQSRRFQRILESFKGNLKKELEDLKRDTRTKRK